MELKELFIYRRQILDECRNPDGYISDDGFLDFCMPWLNDTKYIDSTDYTDLYDPLESGGVKVNAYLLNESGERLQLLLVNEESIDEDFTEAQLMITQKAVYEKQFNRSLSFIKKAIKKQIQELLQDGSPSLLLVHQLGDSDFLDQIDVVEIFLLTATATTETRGATPTPKMLEFENEYLPIQFTKDNQRKTKDILVIKRLIDLNFLYNVHVSQGSRYPLVIDFTQPPFVYPLPFLQAASEPEFDTFLCALPATLLTELYKNYSSRLLEKNVRSFLQLKGVNKGMQDTIRKEPEKFIAYNNGLTITATGSEFIEIDGTSFIKSLSDFQIVNGGQTTATLYFSSKLGLKVDEIKVMAKINVAKDASDEDLDDLISSISTYSNAQSRVSKVDLRARSPQLVKLKSLSDSVLTISGKKWYFERAKGEYATMIRINSNRKSQLEKTYPKERRFTKEELAKYYSSWDDKPYAVKKGGEKIFRLFLEEISGNGKSKKPTVINRQFYEDLIARIILFRKLEDIYGAGARSLGQLRSVVVPYSISALYIHTTGSKTNHAFDLMKIWKAEDLDQDLQTFFRTLMKLMNNLVKKYSKSDDPGEYAKRVELWEDIAGSEELEEFMNNKGTKDLIKKYTISKEELKKREKESAKNEYINFENFLYTATVFDRGVVYYKSILRNLSLELTDSQVFKLNEIIAAINQNKSIEDNHIEFEKQLLKTISVEHPDALPVDGTSDLFKNTANFIVKKYNSAIASGNSIEGTFDLVKQVANKKGVKFYSVFGEIGKALEQGTLPTFVHVKQATEYFKVGTTQSN